MSFIKKPFVAGLVLFSIVLFAIHYYIFHIFYSEIQLFFPLYTIYLFNAILVLVVFSIINYQTHQGKTNSYTTFLILTIVKMALAIVFLIPLFAGKSTQPVIEVINFFIPYFLFLTFEIFSLQKFLKNL